MDLFVNATNERTYHAFIREYYAGTYRLISEITFTGYHDLISFALNMSDIKSITINHTRQKEDHVSGLMILTTQELKDSISLHQATQKGRKKQLEIGVE